MVMASKSSTPLRARKLNHCKCVPRLPLPAIPKYISALSHTCRVGSSRPGGKDETSRPQYVRPLVKHDIEQVLVPSDQVPLQPVSASTSTLRGQTLSTNFWEPPKMPSSEHAKGSTEDGVCESFRTHEFVQESAWRWDVCGDQELLLELGSSSSLRYSPSVASTFGSHETVLGNVIDVSGSPTVSGRFAVAILDVESGSSLRYSPSTASTFASPLESGADVAQSPDVSEALVLATVDAESESSMRTSSPSLLHSALDATEFNNRSGPPVLASRAQHFNIADEDISEADEEYFPACIYACKLVNSEGPVARSADEAELSNLTLDSGVQVFEAPTINKHNNVTIATPVSVDSDVTIWDEGIGAHCAPKVDKETTCTHSVDIIVEAAAERNASRGLFTKPQGQSSAQHVFIQTQPLQWSLGSIENITGNLQDVDRQTLDLESGEVSQRPDSQKALAPASSLRLAPMPSGGTSPPSPRPAKCVITQPQEPCKPHAFPRSLKAHQGHNANTANDFKPVGIELLAHMCSDGCRCDESNGNWISKTEVRSIQKTDHSIESGNVRVTCSGTFTEPHVQSFPNLEPSETTPLQRSSEVCEDGAKSLRKADGNTNKFEPGETAPRYEQTAAPSMPHRLAPMPFSETFSPPPRPAQCAITQPHQPGKPHAIPRSLKLQQ